MVFDLHAPACGFEALVHEEHRGCCGAEEGDLIGNFVDESGGSGDDQIDEVIFDLCFEVFVVGVIG